MNTRFVQYVFDYKDETGTSRTAYARDKTYAKELEEELKAKGFEYVKKKLCYSNCNVV